MTPRVNDLEFLTPPDAASWYDWLAENHAVSPGVWLAVGKKGRSATSLTYDQAVEVAVSFGWIDSTVNRLDDDRFKQLFTPRRPHSVWSSSNKERVARLLAEGRMQPAGLAAVQAAQADGSWTVLDDAENLVVPLDLADALRSTDGAEAGFDSLPASQRKMTLYWISSARRPSTRADRIARVTAAAARGQSALPGAAPVTRTEPGPGV